MSLKRKLPSTSTESWKRVKLEPAVCSSERGKGRHSRAFSSPPQLLTRPFQAHQGAPSNTALRAVRRESFDRKQRERLAETALMQVEDRLAFSIREELALKELRKGLVFKAQPIRRYTMGERKARVVRSVTVPKAPKLQTAIRAEYYTLTRPSYLDNY
jgi:hypothetical protein